MSTSLADLAVDALDRYAADLDAESRRAAAGAMKRLLDAMGSVRLPAEDDREGDLGAACFGAWWLWRTLDSEAEVEAEDATRWARVWREALPVLHALGDHPDAKRFRPLDEFFAAHAQRLAATPLPSITVTHRPDAAEAPLALPALAEGRDLPALRVKPDATPDFPATIASDPARVARDHVIGASSSTGWAASPCSSAPGAPAPGTEARVLPSALDAALVRLLDAVADDVEARLAGDDARPIPSSDDLDPEPTPAPTGSGS